MSNKLVDNRKKMPNNNLFASFQHILDIDQPAVYKLLTYLQNHQGPPSNRELKIQLQYTRYWCVLAKFLYENRHLNFKVPSESPLKFNVVFDQPYTTDCYWYYVFYQVWALTEMLFSELLQKLELRKQVYSDGPVRFPLPTNKVAAYTLYALEVIAMQRFCLEALQTHAKSFNEVVPAFKQALTLKKQWLVMSNLWLTANTERKEIDEDRLRVLNLFQACYLLVVKDSDFQSDDCIQAMGRNARIQSFLSGAEYYWTAEADRPAAGYCYEQAKKEGWRQKMKAEGQLDVERFMVECGKLEFKQPKFIVIADNNNSTEAGDLVQQCYLRGLCLYLDAENYYVLALRPCVANKLVKFHQTSSKSEEESKTADSPNT